MKTYNVPRKIWGVLLAAAIAALMAFPATADNNPANHPIRVLKARYQNDQSTSGMSSSRGNLTIWLQNGADVAVDGVEVEVELYNDRNRKVETLRKSVDTLEAGEKKIVTFRWDIIAERTIKPRFYVEYNARGTQKARFEGDSPSWQ
jgi:hypothetical protein